MKRITIAAMLALAVAVPAQAAQKSAPKTLQVETHKGGNALLKGTDEPDFIRAWVMANRGKDLLEDRESAIEYKLNGIDDPKYDYALVDLQEKAGKPGEPDAVIIYWSMSGFCGSGGCTSDILLIDPETGSLRQVGETWGGSPLPAGSHTRGMRDLVMLTRSYAEAVTPGGAIPSKAEWRKWNGKEYAAAR